MSNRFNYRCPKCGGTDDVVIDAYVGVWLNGDRAQIIEDDDAIGPHRWNQTNPALCLACRYSGLVKHFELRSAQVIPLHTSRRR